MINSTSKKFVLSTLAMMVSSSLWAADTETTDTQKDAIGLERITVTGVARGTRVMDSSVSVSSLSPDDLAVSSPRSSAEAFRIIPGMKVESTGGEGNANIAVRGLPVASGGAKFLQIQEDGLPILQFGDIAFGNADIFYVLIRQRKLSNQSVVVQHQPRPVTRLAVLSTSSAKPVLAMRAVCHLLWVSITTRCVPILNMAQALTIQCVSILVGLLEPVMVHVILATQPTKVARLKLTLQKSLTVAMCVCTSSI